MMTLFTLFFACSPDKENLEEVCDGIDNNGNGLIDEKIYYHKFDNDAGRGISYAGGRMTRHYAEGIGYVEVW